MATPKENSEYLFLYLKEYGFPVLGAVIGQDTMTKQICRQYYLSPTLPNKRLLHLKATFMTSNDAHTSDTLEILLTQETPTFEGYHFEDIGIKGEFERCAYASGPKQRQKFNRADSQEMQNVFATVLEETRHLLENGRAFPRARYVA